MSEHTKGEWTYRGTSRDNGVIIDVDGEYFAEIIFPMRKDRKNIPANACLIAAAPKLLAVCEELAEIFPEHSMSELDAADFKDRAHRIWTASQSAKNTIAKAVIAEAKGD